MMKFIRISSYTILMTILFVWVASTLESCTNKKEINQSQDDISELTEQTADEFFAEEEEFEGESTIDEEDNMYVPEDNESDNESISEALFEEVVLPEVNQNKENSTSNTTTQPKPNKPKSYSSNEKYMIVAGSFLIEENANKLVKKLRNMGYTNAETVIFDRSRYHSVSVARSNDYNKLTRITQQLKSSGIDCYVHTRQD